MRILLANSIGCHVYGGGERWMLRAGRELTARGHEVICWGTHGHRWLSDAQQRGLYCLARPMPRMLDYRTLPDLVDYLRAFGPQAAVLNLDRDALLLGPALRYLGDCRTFLRKGLPAIKENPSLRWAYAQVLDGVITPSERMRGEIVGAGWVPAERVHCIPNGTDPEPKPPCPQRLRMARADLQIRPEDRVILHVGRLTRQKGMIDLVRALPAIGSAFPAARLVVIGTGQMLRTLQVAAEELGVSARVTFLGERWDTDVFFHTADCFAMPSLYEGMSTALLEAMAAGVPAVATPVGGAEEVVIDGRNGRLVPPEDPKALAAAICDVLGEGGRASPMAQRAREDARTHLALGTMISRLEHLLSGRE